MFYFFHYYLKTKGQIKYTLAVYSCFKFFILFILYVGVCLPVRLCTTRVQCPRRPGALAQGELCTGVTDGCELPCGCWEELDCSRAVRILTH